MQTARQRLYYVLTDFVSANLAWFVFNIIRYYTLPYNSVQSLGAYFSMPIVILGQCLFPLMMLVLYAVSGYYNKVFFKSRVSDVLNAAGVSLLGSFIIFFTTLFNDKIDDRLGNFEMLMILWLLFAVFCAVPRLVITNMATQRIWNRQIAFKCMIIGNAKEAQALANDLEGKHRGMGFKVMGIADIDNIDQIATEPGIEAFIIIPTEGEVHKALQIINRLLPLGKSVYITPDTYHIIASRPRTDMVAGQVLIDVAKADIPASTANLKRLGDIFVSSIALLAISPLLGILAVLIKRDSKGPVFYTQERIGYMKKPFKIYKLRSMRTDAEQRGPALSTIDDPRITKIGRVLRKYRLDELPQFWNVLKGDMSLVGPRPERKYYLDKIIEKAPYFNLIHQVRPGITSWGMVKYGYASNVDQMLQRLKYDLLYIDNVSFAVDLKILFYTVRTVVTGRGI